MPQTAAPSVPARGDAEVFFHSTAHPEGRPAALVYSRAMVGPLNVLLVPLMLFALAAVLLGQRIWPYFFWACVPALLLAWAWARFQLGRLPAEVNVRPAQGEAAVRSVHDVLHDRPPVWHRAARLRLEREALRVDLGDTSHRLLVSRWPQAEALSEALRRAARS